MMNHQLSKVGRTERNTQRALSPELDVCSHESRPVERGTETATQAAEDADLGPDHTESILFALAVAVEQRDTMTAGHCERLAFTSVLLGMAMSLDRASLAALYRGGYLHDIGKVGIPDSILFKTGPLTAEEWLIMRAHPARGEEICRPLPSLGPVLPLIRHHHERWDGTGYPDGLRGNQIPLLARVLQIADIYDALTNPRPYKEAYTPKQAIRIIEQETECGWRDPEITAIFTNLHGRVIVKMAEYFGRQEQSLSRLNSLLASLDEIVDQARQCVS